MANDHKLEIVLAAKDVSQKAFKSISGHVTALSKNIFSLQGALVALAGGAGFGALVKSSFDLNDNLAKTSDRLGLTTEALAGLRHAGELTGVRTKTLDMAVQRMTRRISEAAQGSGVAADALDELGLSAQDLAKKSPDEALKDISDAMRGVKNQSDRVRLAFKLFDSEGVKLLNTLDLGSKGLNAAAKEAQDFGLAISRVDAAAIEAANDSFSRAQAAIQGVATVFAVELAPHLEMAATSFADFVKNNRELISLNVEKTISTISEKVKDLVGFYNSIPSEVVGAAGYGIMGRLLFGSWGPAKIAAGVSLINESLKPVRMDLDSMLKDYARASKSLEDFYRIVRETASGERHWWTGNLTSAANRREDFDQTDNFGSSDFQVDDSHRQIPVNAPSTNKRKVLDIWKEGTAWDIDGGAYVESINNYNREVQNSIDLQNRMTEAIDDSYSDYGSIMDGITEDTRQAYSVMDKLSERTAWGMQQNFSNFFYGFKDGVADIGGLFESIVDDMWRIWSQMMAEMAASALFGTNTGGGGNSNTSMWTTAAALLVSILHDGGVVGQTSAPTRSVSPGLFVGAPRLHGGLAPDEFPAILQKGETVIPKNKKAVAGSAPPVTVNVINQTGQQSEAEASVPKFDGESWVIDVVMRNARTNKNGFGSFLQNVGGM
jgi:hypothetical protein